jgi:rubrerythrin
MRSFRYPNKRLGARSAGGRFARPSFESVTGGNCLVCPNPACRQIVFYAAFVERGNFVERAQPPTHCPTCGSSLGPPDPDPMVAST